MIMTQKDSGIVLDILESDRITEERHLMTAGIVVEPEVVETITSCLPFVCRITDIKHDCWFLIEELFKNDGHHFKYFWVVGTMFMLGVIDKEMISTIVHKERVFIETDHIMYLLVGYKAEGNVVYLRQFVWRTQV